MLAFAQKRQRVIDLIKEANVFASQQQYEEIKNRLRDILGMLDQSKMVIVVCGEFKRGKSSLLNALLEEKSLFPVNVDISTNVVTSVSYGAVEKITVIMGKGENQVEKKISRLEIPDYVTEQNNKSNIKEVQMLIIETPNPKLKDGLVFVDTPGVGSLNAEHTAMAYAFIPKADAVIFVSDAEAPLMNSELNFIKRIYKHCKNNLFVLTKIDKALDYNEIITSNREKLSNILGGDKNSFKIIPVSNLAKQDYILSKCKEDLEDSNFEELEKNIWDLAGERNGNKVLMSALGELSKVVAEMKTLSHANWKACQQDSVQEYKNQEAKFQEAIGEKQRLLENNAEWQEQLAIGIRTLQRKIMIGLEQGIAETKQQFAAYLEDKKLLGKPEAIVDLVRSDLGGLICDLEKQLSAGASALEGQIEDNIGVNIDCFAVEPAVVSSAISLDIEKKIESQKMVNNVFVIGRSAMFTASVGSTISALVGGAVGGAIGLTFGGVTVVAGAQVGALIGGKFGLILGNIMGFKEGKKNIQSAEKNEVTKVIMPFIDEKAKNIRYMLEDVIVRLEQTMKSDLRRKIKQQKDHYEKTINSVQDLVKLSKEQSLVKAEEFKGQVQKLENLNNKLQLFAKEMMAKPGTGGRPAPAVQRPVPSQSPGGPAGKKADWI
ncbi:MAG: dynamin family protein [Clostridia bacterium]|nr:dynamin family protein [Clostridia bacterium]